MRRENAESPPCPFPKPRFKKLLSFLGGKWSWSWSEARPWRENKWKTLGGGGALLCNKWCVCAEWEADEIREGVRNARGIRLTPASSVSPGIPGASIREHAVVQIRKVRKYYHDRNLQISGRNFCWTPPSNTRIIYWEVSRRAAASRLRISLSFWSRCDNRDCSEGPSPKSKDSIDRRVWCIVA